MNLPETNELTGLRVIVFSSWRTIESNDDAIEMILISAQRNWARKITGAIWFGETRFFEILEGEDQTIQALYQKIEIDSRHSNPKLWVNRLVQARAFTGWDSNVFDGPESDAIDLLTKNYFTNSNRIWNFIR